MQIGPLTQTDFLKLKRILEEAGFSYEVSLEEGSAHDPKKLTPEQRYNTRPTYVSTIPFIYLDVPAESLLLLKGELDRMAVPVVSRSEELQDESEYFCPKCKFMSEKPGTCPQHGLPLVDYFKRREIRNAEENKTGRWLALVALASFAAFVGGGLTRYNPVLAAGAVGMCVCVITYFVNAYRSER